MLITIIVLSSDTQLNLKEVLGNGRRQTNQKKIGHMPTCGCARAPSSAARQNCKMPTSAAKERAAQ
jgi:hypothetical protein